MILSAIAAKLKQRAKADFKGRHSGATLIVQAVSRSLRLKPTHHVSARLFGAVCPARGVGAGVMMPRPSAASLNTHLAEIARIVTPVGGDA